MYSILKFGGGRGSISAIYNWFENVYLCTDLNPDQYKQYLLRPSAVTKRFFKAKNHKEKRITLNYKQMIKIKVAQKKENNNTVC